MDIIRYIIINYAMTIVFQKVTDKIYEKVIDRFYYKVVERYDEKFILVGEDILVD